MRTDTIKFLTLQETTRLFHRLASYRREKAIFLLAYRHGLLLALHLLQNCMVYINTLMMQQVLARPHWAGRLTPTDLRAVTMKSSGTSVNSVLVNLWRSTRPLAELLFSIALGWIVRLSEPASRFPGRFL